MLEIALTLPIVLVMVLGFVDLGLAVFQTSQASSAAADGARAGVVRWQEADVAGSGDRSAIETAVRAKLVGQDVEAITVACVNAAEVTKACATADPEIDRLEVTVSWTFKPISPIGAAFPNRVLTGRATMGLIDQPSGSTATTTTTSPMGTTTTTTLPTTTTPPTTTTGVPPTCALVSLAADPGSTAVKSGGALDESLEVIATTNGNAACTSLTLRIVTDGSTTISVSLAKVGATTWTATIGKNSHDWTPGSKVAAVSFGSTPLGTYPLVSLT